MANFRDGFLQQGDPLGRFVEFVDVKRNTSSNPIVLKTKKNSVFYLSGTPLYAALVNSVPDGGGLFDMTWSTITKLDYDVGDGIIVTDPNQFSFTGAHLLGNWTIDKADYNGSSYTYAFKVPIDPGGAGVVNIALDPAYRSVEVEAGYKDGQEITLVCGGGVVGVKQSDQLILNTDWYPQNAGESINLTWSNKTKVWSEKSRSKAKPLGVNQFYVNEGSLGLQDILNIQANPWPITIPTDFSPGSNDIFVLDHMFVQVNIDPTPITGSNTLLVGWETGGGVTPCMLLTQKLSDVASSRFLYNNSAFNSGPAAAGGVSVFPSLGGVRLVLTDDGAGPIAGGGDFTGISYKAYYRILNMFGEV